MIDWGAAVLRAGLFAEILPRAIGSARQASIGNDELGIPPSQYRPRIVGESALDEFFIALNAILHNVSSLDVLDARVEACRDVADELSALGVAGANPAQPAPEIIRRARKRVGTTGYHHIDYHSQLTLPGPLVDYDHFTDRVASARVLSGGGTGRRWLIWVHGAAQGRGDDLYAFRAAHLYGSLGFNVAFPVMPAHGHRRAAHVSYPSFDPLLNVAITVRAVAEIRALIAWINTHDPLDITIAGTSLGGPIAGLVAGLEPSVRSVLAVVPMLDLHRTLAHHLDRAGDRGRASAELLRDPAVSAVSSIIDPLSVTPFAEPERRMVIAALNDRVTSTRAAQRLHEHWQGRVHWYPGGHVGHAISNHVRVATDEFLAGRPSTVSGDSVIE